MITRIQVIEKINASLGSNKQVTDRSIAETVEALFATVTEETDLEVFSTLATNVCKTMGGQILNEVSTKIAEAKAAEPKQKTAEELAAQKVIDDANAKADSEMPEYMKVFMASQEAKIEKLNAKIAGVETAKTIEQKKNEILTNAKATYTEDSVVKLAKRFDFSKETATTDFAEACADWGTPIGVSPLAGDGGRKGDDAASFAAQKIELEKSGIVLN
jgi:hypothetical protein